MCSFSSHPPKFQSGASCTTQNLGRSFKHLSCKVVFPTHLLGDELLIRELRRLFLQSEIPAYGVKRPENVIRLMNLLSKKMSPALHPTREATQGRCGLQPAKCDHTWLGEPLSSFIARVHKWTALMYLNTQHVLQIFKAAYWGYLHKSRLLQDFISCRWSHTQTASLLSLRRRQKWAGDLRMTAFVEENLGL